MEPFSPADNRIITAGQVLSSDDPAYKGREHLFEPVASAATRSAAAAETASAAPGERRTRSHATKASNKSEETGS